MFRYKKIIGFFLFSLLFSSIQDVNAQQYDELSADVKEKMDLNKSEGKEVFYGLTRVLTFQLESCGSEEKAGNTLSLMEDLSGFKKIIFVSSGIISFHVDAKVDYTELRDFLISRGVGVFQFHGETFVL